MPKQALETSLDRIDLRILSHLQNNARITNTELADAVGLSPSPCLRRVKALEASGVLKHYAGIIDAKAVGLPISVFISVSLNRQEQQGLKDFEQTVAAHKGAHKPSVRRIRVSH